MLITLQQIKAARALLNWKQSDLAKASGISLPAIAKIEMGHGNPRQATLQAIQQAFETEGLEFLGNHGIDRKQEQFAIQTLRGKQGMMFVWQDMEHAFASGAGGEILLSNLDERPFLKHYGKDMGRVFARRESLNITTRALVNEDETFFLMPLECHRAIPKMLFGQMLYAVYADRVVIYEWNDAQRLIWIQSRALAETFRKQFQYFWAIGKKIDPKKATLWKL